MAEGWKQIWDDFRNALRGETHGETDPSPQAVSSEPPAASAVEDPASTHSSSEAASEGVEPVAVETEQRSARRQRIETAVTVLLIAALSLGLFWFNGGGQLLNQWIARPPAPDVVATFNGGQITTADLEAHFQLLIPEQLRASFRSPQNLRLVIQEMVTDEIARRWATEQKVDEDENFRHITEHVTEDITLDAFNTQLHTERIPVAESEIQAYYETNKARYGNQMLDGVREQIRAELAHQKQSPYLREYIDRLKNNASLTRDFNLLDVPAPSEADLQTFYQTNVPSYTVPARFTVDMLNFPVGKDESAARAAADKALLKLRSAADWAMVSTQTPEARMIMNTVVTKGAQGAEWDAAVGTLQPGELSNVFRASSSLYIVRLIQAQPGRTLTFDEARPTVLAAVQQRQTEVWMKANGNKTLFTIKGKQYTLGQFYGRYKELLPQDQAQFTGRDGLRTLAERMIDRLVLVQDTYDQLLQVKNKDLIDQTRLDVLKEMMHVKEVEDKIQVADQEIRQYYDQHPDHMVLPSKVRIRYIRIGLGNTPDEHNAAHARAEEAYKKLVPGLLQKGADFYAVAREYSEDPQTAAQGGELPDWLGETHNPFESPNLPALHQAALELPVNEISPPLGVGDSVYIIQVIEKARPLPLSFEEAKPYIKQRLSDQKHDQLLLQLQERLAKQVSLVIYDRVLQTYAGKFAPATPAASGGAGHSEP